MLTNTSTAAISEGVQKEGASHATDPAWLLNPAVVLNVVSLATMRAMDLDIVHVPVGVWLPEYDLQPAHHQRNSAKHA